MLYLLTVITIISLVLNTLTYKRITATYPIGTIEEFELEPGQYCWCHVNTEFIEPEPSEVQFDPEGLDSISAPTFGNPHQAWENRKEIPWVPPTKVPEPIVKPVNRGPLARPDGFI